MPVSFQDARLCSVLRSGRTHAWAHAPDPRYVQILSEEMWQRRLNDADRRALSPLFWSHVNAHVRFKLDMNSHLDLVVVA